jgi:hypothetical protein
MRDQQPPQPLEYRAPERRGPVVVPILCFVVGIPVVAICLWAYAKYHEGGAVGAPALVFAALGAALCFVGMLLLRKKPAE